MKMKMGPVGKSLATKHRPLTWDHGQSGVSKRLQRKAPMSVHMLISLTEDRKYSSRSAAETARESRSVSRDGQATKIVLVDMGLKDSRALFSRPHSVLCDVSPGLLVPRALGLCPAGAFTVPTPTRTAGS